jgi:hypothetical protein
VSRLNRRKFLTAVGAGAAAGAAVPLLSPFGTRADGATPKRLVVIFTPNGTIPENFWPTGPEADMRLGRILEPLAPYREQMMVLAGLDMDTRAEGPGNGHTKGIGHLLTGIELLEGDLVDGMGRPSGYAGGPSVDQVIARHIGEGTRIESIVAGCRVRIPATPVRARLSYRAANEPLVPNDDPRSLASFVFGDSTDREAMLRTWERRQSILDHSTGALADLASRVGTEDRLRIEAHQQSVRELERNLAPDATLCERPALASGLDPSAERDYPAISAAQAEIISAAFRCDVSRVASVLYSSTQSGQRFQWLGFDESHHGLSHEPDSNTDARSKLTDINRWYAEQVAYYCEQLASHTDPDGTTLLDNTLVVWCNEMGTGNSHSAQNLPFVLIGGGAGFRMGRHLDFGGRPHNDLLISLMNAYGVDGEIFGDPRYCNGPLAGLT